MIGQMIVSALQASTELHAMMQILSPDVQPPVHSGGQARPGGMKSSPHIRPPPLPPVLELAATVLVAPPIPVLLDAPTVIVPPAPPALLLLLPPVLVVEARSGARPERSRLQPMTTAIATKALRSIVCRMVHKRLRPSRFRKKRKRASSKFHSRAGERDACCGCFPRS